MSGDDQHLDHMHVWGLLRNAALLGTERSGASVLDSSVLRGENKLAEGLTSIKSMGGTQERTLLLSAAAVDHYQRVGAIAETTEKFDDTSERGDSEAHVPEPPVCSAAASQILDMLLSSTLAVAGQQHKLIALWAERCVASGFSMAPRQLVAILHHATSHRFQHRVLEEPVARVVGNPGRLLASLNPDWAWIQEESTQLAPVSPVPISPEVFDLTDTKLRSGLLREWRHRNPRAALEAVQPGWAANKATERSELLDALRVGFSVDDEPFLERCLDDKAKGVRSGAAGLLSSLPTSAFAHRMSARIKPLVRVERSGLLRRQTLEIELPEESDVDPSWARDGVDLTNVPSGTGRRAWILHQLVMSAPLGAWEEVTGLTPIQILEAMHASSLLSELTTSWAFAASRQGNAAWADALCEKSSQVSWQASASLTSEALNRHVQRLLALPNPTGAGLYNLLSSRPEELTGATLDRLIDWLASDPVHWVNADVTSWLGLANSSQINSLLQRFDREDHRHKQIRHLEAARSIRDAILKEFP
jgi:hypothetical protein